MTPSNGYASDALPAPLCDLVLGHEKLRAAVAEAVRCIEASGRISLGIAGGAANGVFDRFSDVDLVLAVDGPDDMSHAIAAAHRIIEALGRELVLFPADHIGASNMIVGYLRRGTDIFKVDILVLDVSSRPALPDKFLSIRDETGRFAGIRRMQTGVDHLLLLKKLAGWLWFTYSRVARGELLAAARSIDFSREAALLPLLLDRLKLPQEGHRRLEMRLPADLLASLRATYPAPPARQELMASLRALHSLILLEMDARPDPDVAVLRQAIDEIWACIESAETPAIKE